MVDSFRTEEMRREIEEREKKRETEEQGEKLKL